MLTPIHCPESTVAFLRVDNALDPQTAQLIATELADTLGANAGEAFSSGRQVHWHIDNEYYSADVQLAYVSQFDVPSLAGIPAIVALMRGNVDTSERKHILGLLSTLGSLPVALVYAHGGASDTEEAEFGVNGWEITDTEHIRESLMLHTWPCLSLKSNGMDETDPEAERRLAEIESHLAGKVDGDSFGLVQPHPELQSKLEEFLESDDDFGDFVHGENIEPTANTSTEALPSGLDTQVDAFTHLRTQVEHVRNMPNGPLKEQAALAVILSLNQSMPEQ